MTQMKDETLERPMNGYTLSEALEIAGMGLYHWMLISLNGAIFAIDGLQAFMMVFLVPIISDVWDLESPWDSMIPVSFLLGALIANIVWSKIADVYGRKITIISAITLTAISATATVFVPNIWCLLACRFFCGMGFAQPVVVILVIEFSPVKERAKSVMYTYFCWTAGGLLSALLAWLILPNMDEETGWRYYVLSTCFPTWIIVVASIWIPESPRWYCTVGEFGKAENVIRKLFKINGKEPIEGEMIQENKSIKLRGKIKDLFVPKYRKASCILAFVYMTAISVYWGIDFISGRLFENSSLYLSVSVTNLSEIPAVASTILMNRIGWRYMTLYTRGITSLCLAVVAFQYYSTISVSYIEIINVVLVFIARGLSLASSMVILVYYSTYYPTAIRVTAVGFGYGFSRVGAMGFMFIAEDLDIGSGLLILSIVSLLSCVPSLFLKNMTIKEELVNKVDRSECQNTGRNSINNRDSNKYVLV